MYQGGQREGVAAISCTRTLLTFVEKGTFNFNPTIKKNLAKHLEGRGESQ